MRNLIHNSLDVAWRAMGSLKTPATLLRKKVSGFDFGNAAVVSEDLSDVNVKIIILKSSYYNGIYTKKVLLKQRDVGDITMYDRMELAGEEWLLSPIMPGDDGYTKYLLLTRRGL